MLSKFYRNKLIRKEGPKGQCIAIIGDRCFIYETFVDGLLGRSSRYTINNLKALLDALVDVSKQEISDGCHPFCLEKIN